MKYVSAVMIAILLMALPLTAGETSWKVDVSHSNVLFTVSHLVISEVTGRFTDFDATLINSREDFSDSKLSATIKMASVNTDNESRDKHLRSADFFDVEKYPEMKFTSKTFQKTGDATFKITGDLTMRGVTKEVVLDAKLKGVIKDPWGNTKSGFTATTTINRSDFGVSWNKTLDSGGFVVGNSVEVTIQVEFAQQADKK